MADLGLTRRLNHRSRRSGLIIGISMLLTLAFCVAAFTVIYTALDRFTSDFVSSSGAATEEAREIQANAGLVPALQEAEQQIANAEGDGTDPAPQQTDAPAPTSPATTEAEATEPADPDAFNPDYQILPSGARINLREGPSTATSIVNTLDPGTPLQYMNEEAPTQSGSDGSRWMLFQTEDGQEGWVREIDTAPLDD